MTSLLFAHPLLLLIAPALGILALFTRRRPAVAAPITSIEMTRNLPVSFRLKIRAPLLLVLSAITIGALVLAAAQPQRVAAIETVQQRRNLILALDLSRSMEAVDFNGLHDRISRIRAVKTVVKKFIDARTDDRIGIVVFGTKAFVQAPLTLDHAVLQELVDDIRVGMAGDATAIGDGLGLSLKRLKDVPPDSAAIILLTDGVSNSGQLEPLTVAQIAKQKGIKIHTIGIGSSEDVVAGNAGFFSGEMQEAAYDETTLKQIADATGGLYFNARNLAGLTNVYDEIDKLERSQAKDPHQEIFDQFFPIAAAAAIAAYLLYLLAARGWLLKVP